MQAEQIKLLTIIVLTLVFFLWGKFRHDIVAIGCLLISVLTGLVSSESAFMGFGHPAVITVASVLIISKALQNIGVIDLLIEHTLPATRHFTTTLLLLSLLGAFLSAFINNVGAMALLMPLAVQKADKFNQPVGKLLMPLSFATILGGMITLIGTPPNLIVAGFRMQAKQDSFSMFDFSPVGLVITVIGISFIALIGWRIVPSRKQKSSQGFDTGTYLIEAIVDEKSFITGKLIREVDSLLDEMDAQIVGLVRNKFRVIAPHPGRYLRKDDILIIEAEPESLTSVLAKLELKLAHDLSKHDSDDSKTLEDRKTDEFTDRDPSKDIEHDKDDIQLQEWVVMPTSKLLGRSGYDIQLGTRFGINLLAISRQGRQSVSRLRYTPMKAGDVLLLQGTQDTLSGFATEMNCLPLAKRSIHIKNKNKVAFAAAIMLSAIIIAALGLTSAAISFAGALFVFVILRLIPARELYEAVDWSIIVLLAALIPVASAMTTSGTADQIASLLIENFAKDSPMLALILILITTMTLSDFMNNAATAAVMCPIAISAAMNYNLNVDPFLMAVAIGASCAFLTPIGHQNNLLILGPGGFRFTDYWRLGLPIEIFVVLVSALILPIFWPL